MLGVININTDNRPNPQYLLNQIKREEKESNRGKLKIFFGYSAGVGKSYTMLMEAHDLKKLGEDIIIGYIEPHARPETMALVNELECIQTKTIDYKGIKINEFDLDTALLRKPKIILVDELAHTNASTCRHRKRWQDIMELLDNGIDVYTTLNVQHIESLNNIVESITQISVRETIPDKVFDDADNVELIDIEPDELLKRFSDGKIYSKDQTKRAFNNFFTKNNLFALREIALRRTADRVSNEIDSERLSKSQITVVPTSDPILVCIGPSPSSAKVIRTAKRMAEAHHSKWIAVYIETSSSQNLSKEDKERLKTNINLAEQLGAEVATLYGDNIVEQIIEYAKFRNVTKIIIGKNHRKPNNLFKYFAKDIVDKLMDFNFNIDVYIIPNPTYQKNGLNRKYMTKFYKPTGREILMSSIIMIIATLVSALFTHLGFTETNVIMVFILGVIFINVETEGNLIGVIFSIISVLLVNYFFTEPKYSFFLYDKSYYVTFLIMIMVNLIVATLTNRIKMEANDSLSREKRTQILYRVSKKLLSATGKSDVVSIGIKYISRLLDRTVICYLIEGTKFSNPYIFNVDNSQKKCGLLSNEEQAVAYWSFLNDKEAGTGTSTFYGAKGYYFPLKIQNQILGIIGIACDNESLKTEEKFIFKTVSSQISVALDREILAETQENNKLEIESERLRSNLLRSISHDLRSPLAGIKGAISTIIENGKNISEEKKEELLQDVYGDTEWLIRLVENLLSMTKFDEGNMEIKKSVELIEDVIYEVVQRTIKRFTDHKIKVTVPEDVIMAPMDVGLIEQVLINLIDNALKFTPKGSIIEIKAYEQDQKVNFEVIDNGYGVPKEIQQHIFDRFYTNGSNSADSRRGVGLGLAICKSIVEAHGGIIEVQNSADGGAIFRFNIIKEAYSNE